MTTTASLFMDSPLGIVFAIAIFWLVLGDHKWLR